MKRATCRSWRADTGMGRVKELDAESGGGLRAFDGSGGRGRCLRAWSGSGWSVAGGEASEGCLSRVLASTLQGQRRYGRLGQCERGQGDPKGAERRAALAPRRAEQGRAGDNAGLVARFLGGSPSQFEGTLAEGHRGWRGPEPGTSYASWAGASSGAAMPLWRARCCARNCL